jgi:hypothetical protein
LVFSEEQLEKIRQEWEAKYSGPSPDTKAGAVLNAKNKAALVQAQTLIQQVLAAAEPASEEGKGATPNQSIYSLALNPGEEPHGGRQAGGSETAEADIEELRSLTQSLHHTVCK